MPVPHRRRWSAPLVVVLSLLLVGAGRATAQTPTTGTLPSFASEEQLRAFLVKLRPPPRSEFGAFVSGAQDPTCTPADSTTPSLPRRRWPWNRSAAPKRVVITGTVRDPSGKGIYGASVRLTCDQLAQSTDTAGQYRFEFPREARARSVRVHIRAIGYRALRDTIRLVPGDSVVRVDSLRRDVMHLEQVAVSGLYSSSSAKVAIAMDESITNTQHEGVDEGGIVKVHGEHLVVLRRGRLFTVRAGDDALTPVAMVNAFPPDAGKRGGWYDELVISGDRAVVVGYSYARMATELNLFRLDAEGGIRYEDTYHLRSNDYYSSENYASRVIGSTLYLYTPLWVRSEGDPLASLPALRRWSAGSDSGTFTRIARPSNVHYVPGALAQGDVVALHTVTRCELTVEPMRCDSRVVVGPPGQVFYVSPNAVYLWTSALRWGRSREGPSLVVRVPLDGGAPSGVRATGSPIDQFSFLEADGMLNVLVDARGMGDGMWNSQRSARDLTLARFSLDRFGDGSDSLPPSLFLRVPDPGPGALQNRFVGRYLLYGAGNGWFAQPTRAAWRLTAVEVDHGRISQFDLAHRIDRIEAMGEDAIVIGGAGKYLHLAALRLGETPSLAHRYRLANAAQSETRSHGYFYKPSDARTGMLGLPIAGGSRRAYQQLWAGAASVLFLRNDGDAFSDAGALDATEMKTRDDACIASCVDWYGNARPIFLRGRVYALMGYEVVEGRVVDGRVQEVRRVDFLPRMVGSAKR